MAVVHAYETKRGKRYRVRYRTPDNRQTDKRGFKRKRDAEQFANTVEVSKLRASTSTPPTPARPWTPSGKPGWNARKDTSSRSTDWQGSGGHAPIRLGHQQVPVEGEPPAVAGSQGFGMGIAERARGVQIDSRSRRLAAFKSTCRE
jgi:hypothetical protein